MKNEEHRSLFVFDDFLDKGHSIQKIYALYGASSGADIASLSYVIHGSQRIEEGTVTDRTKIDTFYDITAQLVPHGSGPVSETPDWLAKAYEEASSDPEYDKKREDIDICVRSTNGMIYRGIYYQPYISTGYVAHMEALTPEQNAQLRNAITAD